MALSLPGIQLPRLGIPKAIGRAALPEPPRAGKSFLQKLFEELDLPGNVVRNVLTGNIGGAGRNIADIVTGLSMTRYIPGFGKHLQLTREKKDRPSFGFVGDILTDPLTWISFGGAGAAAKLGKAAAKGATKRTMASMLSGMLTKTGRKGVATQVAKTATELARRSAFARKLPQKGLERLAERMVLKGSPRFGVSGLLGKVMKGTAGKAVRVGGIGLGIPFREPAVSFLKGKDVLGYLPPSLALTKTQAGRKIMDTVRKVFRPLSRMSPEGGRIAGQYRNEIGQAGVKAQATVRRIFGDITPDMAKDITTAISEFDPRMPEAGVDSLKSLFSKYQGDDLAKIKKAVTGWQDEAGRMLAREKELGLLKGSKISSKRYMPLQWTDEYADQVAAAALEGNLKPAYSGLATKSRFFKHRKHPGLKEFVEAGHIPELDARKLGLLRVHAHERVVANARLIRQANTFLGVEGARLSPLTRAIKGAVPEQEVIKAVRGRKFVGRVDKAGDLIITGKKRGKEAGQAIVRKMGENTWELQKVAGEGKPALFAAAQEQVARQGGTLTIAEHLRLPTQPKLQRLTDRVFEKWIRTDKAGNLQARKGILKLINRYNQKLFKGLVTTGIGPLVNVKFITRNVLSGVFQAATDEDLALAGFKHFKPMVDGIMAKASQAFGFRFQGGAVNRLLRGITEGIEVGRYTGDDVLRLARQHGAIDSGFTAVEFAKQLSEGAIGAGVPKGVLAKALRPMHRVIKPRLAQRVMNYSENAMRLNGFMELLRKGLDPRVAAERVTKAFIDYRYTSGIERGLRDVFPFAKFTIEQTPRTIEAALRRPVLTQPWRALARQGQEVEGPLPEWMEGQPVIPLGRGPKGPRVMYQFGTPLEDLERLGTGKGVGRTMEQTLVGSLTPPLKWLYEATAGKEPFTGREIEKMTRAPASVAAGLRPLPDVIKKVLGVEEIETKSGYKFTKVPWQVGAVLREQPLTVQFRTFDKMWDDREGLIAKTLNMITGMRVLEIDKEYEMRRRIRDYLIAKVQRGEVGEFSRFFATGDTSPELTQIIKMYYAVGKKGRK
jgi:hypothetical protein